jgi:NTP pyrophosphatase (non-canonical NTP hydrolase)
LDKFNDYQEFAVTTVNNGLSKRDQLANFAMGTAGEAGEVADIVKKHLYQGHELDVNALTKEVGDVLWYLANLCTQVDISFADVAQKNMQKLKARYPDGFKTADSEDRND